MRSQRIALRNCWLSVLALVGMTTAADAAGRPPADQVALRNGAKFRGVLFERSDKSLTLLVSAKWLSTANVKLHDTARKQNVADHAAGLEQLVRRLKADPAPIGNDAVAAFLKDQSASAAAGLQGANKFEPDFLWLTFPMKDVARVEPTTMEYRQLLTWAWTEELDRPEARSSEELSRELKARNVSPVGWPLTFIERLPAREQSDDEWAARRALVAYALGKRLDFQGTGDVLARTGQDIQQADVGQLLVDLLRQQLQSQFGDLLGEGKANKRPPENAADSLRKAIEVAESEKRAGFRVTRLSLANDFQQATVKTEFVVRLADRSWRTVFQHMERADANQARPDVEKRINDDPRVKQVLDLTRQLGLTAEGQIQQALRFGAATMTAQQSCDREFAAFRDIYLLSLAKPPISLNRAVSASQ